NNPGLASIQAAVAPARVDYLYFVANGQGRHIFSQTIEEHNRAVHELRQRN
ncbi:MAG: endolytic transglycosylase MltG, partial [Fidelibacterota bacterium]